MNRQELALAQFLLTTAEEAWDQQDLLAQEGTEILYSGWKIPVHGMLRAIDTLSRKAFHDLTGRWVHEVHIDDLNPQAPAHWAASHNAGAPL